MDEPRLDELDEAALLAAHRRSIHNRGQVGGRCGCFNCRSLFDGTRITRWTDAEQTALCPICGMDSVVPEADAPLTLAMLEQMHRRWFKQRHWA